MTPLPAAAGPPSRAGGYDILVVDDNAEMRAYIRRCLRGYEGGGHRIREAADGLEALALLAGQPFDLVISDVVMPRMDGLTLCHNLGVHYPEVPLLLISGEASGEASRQARLHPAGGTLAKPFNARKLRLALDHLLHPA